MLHSDPDFVSSYAGKKIIFSSAVAYGLGQLFSTGQPFVRTKYIISPNFSPYLQNTHTHTKGQE